MTIYTDIEQIGEGGFCEVFRCKCEKDQTLWAKKKLDASSNPEIIERFKQEIRILSNLDHPNVIKIIATRLQSPPYFYIMPLYKWSLDVFLKRTIWNQQLVNSIFLKILDALEYAHQQNVIHRDLKPENVLLDKKNNIVVSDFGLGRIVDDSRPRLTSSGRGMGTPDYMAPEQRHNAKNATYQSDIFSLGKILSELYNSNLNGMDITPPASVVFIIEKCTQENPDKRYQSVSELKSVWRTAHEEIDRQSNSEEIEDEITIFTGNARLSSEEVSGLCALFLRVLGNPDIVNDIIMRLPPQAMGMVFRKDEVLAKNIIDCFVKYISVQSWPFGYTDRIANKCNDIYNEIPDQRIRAKLFVCIIIIGITHNRFYIFRMIRNLWDSERDVAGWIALEDELRHCLLHHHMGQSIIRELNEHVNLDRTTSTLAGWLRSWVKNTKPSTGYV